MKKGITLARILVLEDDKLFNETLEDFLEEEGHTLYCALDPYTAIDLTYENVFDLYLFEVHELCFQPLQPPLCRLCWELSDVV